MSYIEKVKGIEDNWYNVLELGFDPPVEDESVINRRIIEKKEFWSANNTKNSQYGSWRDKESQIRKDMIGAYNIREKLAKEMLAAVCKEVDNKLKYAGSSADENFCENLGKKYGISKEKVLNRANALGIEVKKSSGNASGGTNEKYAEAYKKYYRTKPANAPDSTVASALLVVSAKDLYTFLKPELLEKDYSAQDCGELRTIAAEKMKKYNHHDTESAKGKQLCSKCALIFKDEKSKADYDNFLEYNKRREVLDKAAEIAKLMSDELSAEASENFVNELASLMKNMEEARNLFMGFCEKKNIKTELAKSSTEEKRNVKICRCGHINDVSGGRKICEECGQPLFIKCPKCGAENDASVKVCKCGFNYKNIDRAVYLCDMAEKAINKLMYDIAEGYIKEAERCYKDVKGLAELKIRLNESKDRFGAYAADLDKYVKSGEFYAALEKLNKIESIFPDYSDKPLKDKITEKVVMAKGFFERAERASDENEIIELAEKAFAACRDYPGIRTLIEKHPPMPPERLEAVCDGVRRVNRISWSVSGNKSGAVYTVVRNDSKIPANAGDGKIIGRVSLSSIDDRDVLGGRQYYYAVFAERAGVFSKPAICEKPVLCLFEAGGAEAAAGDSSVKITWKDIPRGAEVSVFRIEGGREKLLGTSSGREYFDSGLENDREYAYRIAAVYTVGGRKVQSSGIILKAAPSKLPKAVEGVSVRQLAEERFELKWKECSDGEVMFFVSKNAPPYKTGEIVSSESVRKSMEALQFVSSDRTGGEQTAVFRHYDEGLIYIMPVTFKKSIGVVGETIRANRSGNVKINDVKIINNKIGIFTAPPKNASGFVVFYNENEFVTDVNDKSSNKVRINMEQFKLSSMIYINEAEEKKYFITLFAEYGDGDKKDYSAPAFFEFDNSGLVNITYCPRIEKRFLGPKQLVITFEADKKSFWLPELEVTAGRENVPVFRRSAELLKTIEGQKAEGKLTVKIPLDKQYSRNVYIKVFLKDEELASKYLLRLGVGFSHKVC